MTTNHPDAPGFPDVLTGDTGLTLLPTIDGYDSDGAPLCAGCGGRMEVYRDTEGEDVYCPCCWAYSITSPS